VPLRPIPPCLLARIGGIVRDRCDRRAIHHVVKLDYLGKNDRDRHGSAYLGAELKALRFDGVEFFCEVVALYQESGGALTLKESPSATRLAANAFVVGVVPYEWIEFVEAQGDEFSYRPQFFTQFKGPEKSPYKYLRYYRKSETYDPKNDPADMQWSTVELLPSTISR
jgi:hypothetical protein